MTKRDPGGRKRRLKLINEARRRRKDDDVGGVSRLETTTTTTTTTDFGGATLATKEKDHPKQRDFGGDAMAFGVVAKHAMKKATKKAKFLESACASVFSFRAKALREMERGRLGPVPVFFSSLPIVYPNRLTTSSSLLVRCARTQRYVGRTNQTPPLEHPSRKNNRANRSRRSARASSLAWRISPRISTHRCWRRRRRYKGGAGVRGRRRCRRCCRTR